VVLLGRSAIAASVIGAVSVASGDDNGIAKRVRGPEVKGRNLTARFIQPVARAADAALRQCSIEPSEPIARRSAMHSAVLRQYP
jgi:hypothetical protein